MAAFLREQVTMKHVKLIPAEGESSFEHLRRQRVTTEDGSYIKADPRHIERIAVDLGLDESKLVATLLAANDQNDGESDSPALGPELKRSTRMWWTLCCRLPTIGATLPMMPGSWRRTWSSRTRPAGKGREES